MGYTRYTRVYPIVDYGVTITTSVLHHHHVEAWVQQTRRSADAQQHRDRATRHNYERN